ncbi:KATNB1-like protein 1 isoform X3 [Acropora millepora]|uniref:KATNB1-like protein 1 isoform X3 n=1 Tax=Acropora millepora TaxID=45264 RepID=UPI001CF2A1AD|nr:KATNB1-like protein 1 isoform X3 [Acropora millepora]
MAERNGEGGGEQIGFFYYDWAQSQYKWTDDNHLKNFRVRKVVRSSSEVKDAVSDCSPMPGFHNGGNIDGEASFVHNVKLPLQDKDVNQLSRCKKISKGHATMITVLQTRLLRLRAAQTLWHKDTNALIEYLLRMKDDSVLVDVMPFLTSRVREVSPDGQALSMGACLEMLPALERLLTSKFEDYVIAGLNMIREMIKRWWMQLKVATKKGVEPECQRCSRSVSGLYMAIVSLSAVIVKLSKRRGRVREKAVVVTRLLDLL